MANRIERIGVNHCGEIAERNNWMFREQPVDDVGIDVGQDKLAAGLHHHEDRRKHKTVPAPFHVGKISFHVRSFPSERI